jgi:purine nucleoside phosphorylase
MPKKKSPQNSKLSTKKESVKIGIIGGSGLYHMAGLTAAAIAFRPARSIIAPTFAR